MGRGAGQRGARGRERFEERDELDVVKVLPMVKWEMSKLALSKSIAIARAMEIELVQGTFEVENSIFGLVSSGRCCSL